MNATGLQTLFVKEVRRFLRVPGQTVLSPLISTTLYFAVFGVSLGGRMEEAPGSRTSRSSSPAWCSSGWRTTPSSTPAARSSS